MGLLATSPGGNVNYARIFEEDPELLHRVERADADRLRSQISVPVLTPARGEWCPSEEIRQHAVLGMFILEGLLVRRVEVLGRASVELLGAGDILVHRLAAEYASVPQPDSLRVISDGARIGILDEGFVRRTSSIASLRAALLQRAVQRSCSAMLQLAVARLPKASERLLVVLWHLADRWGYWRSGRIVLPVPLTHALLGELISTNREAVTKSALPQLIKAGRVSRRADGMLELHPPAPHLVDARAVARGPQQQSVA